MSAQGFALFDTAIGHCGIAWNDRGVVGLQLPEACAADTRSRLRRRFASAREMPPPPEIGQAIAGIVALLQGKPVDLSAVPLDMNGVSLFHRRVYELARGIGPGHTLTYGEIAARLGEPGSARAVGHALGRNPFAIIVPCHRVLAAGGGLGGFSAPGGVETKLRLLAIEGARPDREPDLFDEAEASRPEFESPA
jgi:methylated-DNA-[protein]-cysteine S-methyltransferase